MPNPVKAQLWEKRLDEARCKGNWSEIKEMARKYRKHKPEGIGMLKAFDVLAELSVTFLEHTALAELSLVLAIQKTENETSSTSEVYNNDDPDQISVGPIVDGSRITEVFEKLDIAIVCAEGDDKKYASIVLGRAYFVTGAYARCLNTLNASFIPSKVSPGYSFVLLIQGLTIKGTALEMIGKLDQAIRCYDEVVKLLGQRSSEQPEQLIYWAEEALYRVALLKVRVGDTNGALEAFRTYQLYAAIWDKFQLNKKAIIYRNFIKFLSKTYQEGTYVPPSISETFSLNGSSSLLTPHTFRSELTEIHTQYENVLYKLTSFPKAGEVNWRVLEMVDQVMSDWALVGYGKTSEMRSVVEDNARWMLFLHSKGARKYRAFPYIFSPCSSFFKRDRIARDYLRETISCMIEHARWKIFQMLYRAAEMTFHSPRILRHLLNTLITMGEYEEAELALSAYIAMVEKTKEIQKKEIEQTLYNSNPYDSKAVEIETTPDAVRTLLRGVDLMGKYLKNSTKALEYAEKALKLYHEDESKIDTKLLAQIWRCVGVGYKLLAIEATDSETRPNLHEKAITAFKNSIEIDPEYFEAHYQLALEYAITHEITQAIVTVQQALVLENSNIPCWHLLALLYSSKKDIQGALKTCEAAAKKSLWETADFSVDYETLTAIGNDDGEEFFSFKMTRCSLLELAQGPEAAIQNHQELFKLYGKIFPDNTISPTGSVYESIGVRKKDTSDENLVIQTPKILSTKSSRNFSNFRHKKEENTSSDGSVQSFGNSKDTLEVPKANYASSIASSKNSSSSIRRSPTPTISGIGSIKSILPSNTYSQLPLSVRKRRKRATKALADIWLASASSFRRLGNLEETQKALECAEEIDGANPDIWCQLGLYHFCQSNYPLAITSFHKALSLDTLHVPSLVHLGRTYLIMGEIELGKGVLESITKGNGWDCPEAWFYLGKACEATNRIQQTKDCFWHALALEETKPVRPFHILPLCL
ncbi:hypothetical protein G9A89_016508 [Geosiphon pyriformis]|nr:hypothetical protein G9A89_016508 [Geosiphon pyriformis]